MQRKDNHGLWINQMNIICLTWGAACPQSGTSLFCTKQLCSPGLVFPVKRCIYKVFPLSCGCLWSRAPSPGRLWYSSCALSCCFITDLLLLLICCCLAGSCVWFGLAALMKDGAVGQNGWAEGCSEAGLQQWLPLSYNQVVVWEICNSAIKYRGWTRGPSRL